MDNDLNLDTAANLVQGNELTERWKTNYRLIFRQIQKELKYTGNVSCLLPLLFRFNGEPITLKDHFSFEVNFYHRRPRRVIKKCGRQVGKSFQNALELLIRGLCIKGWNILYVTPLQEQAQRFSQDYVHALIEESPAKRLLTLKGASSRVFSRTLGNGSTLRFTYAQRDANRARGINASEVAYDEAQLMNREVIPVLQQVMGGSKWGEYELFAGTPLGRGNVLEENWQQSTMSQWMIPCRSCGYHNIASVDEDLVKMIGPPMDDIHPGGIDKSTGKKIKRVPGLVCARCSPHNEQKNLKHLFPEDGRWLHFAPERRNDFLGIHVPQPITTTHAYSRDRWVKLNNRLVSGNTGEIYNEILGEACDAGFKPVSETDLKRAACLSHKNTIPEAYDVSPAYARLAMGIDWGGGGVSGISRTKAAIVGLTSTGKTDVILGLDVTSTSNVEKEVAILVSLAAKFGCEFIAHDVGGGVGSVRESLIYKTGSLASRIWPICYTGPMTAAMMKLRKGNQPGETPTWVLDKAKAIMFACQAIKQGHIRFFQHDYVSKENPGLLNDFLALFTDINHNPAASDKLVVDREEGLSDDFVHAVTFACVTLWSNYKAFPKLDNGILDDELMKAKTTFDMAAEAKSMSINDLDRMYKEVTGISVI